MEIRINVGPKMFELPSFEHWVNHAKWIFADAKERYRTKDYICIDSVGRICLKGAEFMRARDENTFPVRVYASLNEVEELHANSN